MKWDEGHESPDVVDRRGERGGGGDGGGGGRMGLLSLVPMLLRMRGGWVILLVLLGVSAAGKFSGLLDRAGGAGGAGDESRPVAAVPGAKVSDKKGQFVAFVLDDNQAMWRKELPVRGKAYRNAKLVMFTGSTATACGQGMAATGPFYCPPDERVYIDLSFYDELEKRLGAKGDFAQAYVISHEIGHHVQNILGTSDKVRAASPSRLKGEDGLSVRLELQADCFAGVWAHSANKRGILDAGDIDEALTAAAAIGDDRLQKQATGHVNPEKWTHGSSAQRGRAFKTGYERGLMEACDTFSGNPL